MRINVEEVLKRAKEKEADPEPQIVIKINREVKTDPPVPTQQNSTQGQQISAASQSISPLADGCWADYHKQKLERRKLSTQIAALVAAGSSRSELATHYATIETYSQTMRQLYDIAMFAEQNGKLPDSDEGTNAELLDLKDKRRKLVDLRSKLQAKIRKSTAKNPDRITTWHLELDKANAEYDVIDNRIKTLAGK